MTEPRRPLAAARGRSRLPDDHMDHITLHCRAVLFDMDGVLVDSHSVVVRTWNRWADRHGLHIPDLVNRAHGRRTIETVREVTPWLDADAEERWLAGAEEADTDGLSALPGAATALQALSNAERAIVTSSGRGLARVRLGHVGLPTPAVLVTADDVRSGKPSPDAYLQAAARLGVDPAECIVIEDAPAGIAAGRAAGARVIALTTTFPAAELTGASAIVPSLAAVRFEHEAGELWVSVGAASPGSESA